MGVVQDLQKKFNRSFWELLLTSTGFRRDLDFKGVLRGLRLLSAERIMGFQLMLRGIAPFGDRVDATGEVDRETIKAVKVFWHAAS